jgi:IS4 transposase
MSQAKSHEVHWLDQLLFEPGSFYIMDRGYLDFKRLHHIHNAGAFFLIRAKNNTALQRVYSRPIDKPNGVHVDQTVRLLNFYARKDYPQHLRLVKFYHPSYEHTLLLLTNNFELPALTIAMLYKARWQIELFFKWIKQNLRIKSFYGTSDNAVRTQIWIAVCVYVLVAIIKKQLNLPQSLYQILQILSINAFEKTSLHQLLTKTDYPTLS